MILESIMCLALNVYHESKNQSFVGQVAVAQVVMNRVQDSRYPNNVCDVVKQGLTYKWKPTLPIKNKCQFSWYCDGVGDEVKDKKTYQKILDLSYLILHNEVEFIDITDGATHYHADYVKPSWAKTKTRTTEIGDHIFYRWEKK